MLVAAAAGVLVAGRGAGAQDQADPGRTALDAVTTDDPQPDERAAVGLGETRIEIEPALWLPALNGDISLGGGDRFDVETIDADEVRASGQLVARVYASRWTFGASGFLFSFDDDSSASSDVDFGSFAVDAGDEVESDIDIGIFQAYAGYRIWNLDARDSRTKGDDGLAALSEDVSVALSILGGVRVVSASMEFEAVDGTAAGSSADFDETWVDPFVGASLDMRFGREDQFRVGVMGNIGGFPQSDGSSFSWEIVPRFEYAPTRNLGVQIGFRHVSFGFDDGGDDGDEIDTALAGLFLAAVVRF